MATAWENTAPRAELALPDWLVRIFALDVRSLIALRVGMAALLLVDLAVRARDLVAHYTDAGVLPREARIAMQWDFSEPWWMSLHMLSGSAWWQAALFTIAAVAATMLLLGYRTRFAVFVSWLLLFSLHARFPLLTQGGDALLRCMLFWSMFLPLTKAEVRRQRSEVRGQKSEGRLVCSWGTAAFVVQLAVMYIFTAMLKTGPAWRYDFSATYYALSIDHFTSELGYFLLSYPRLLQVLTFSAILLEWIGPLLLLVPIRQTWVRIVIPLAFIGFHLGLAAAMDLGTFPWICILFWVALLPPAAWDWLEQMLGVARECLGLGKRELPPCNMPKCEFEPVALIGSVASNLIAAFLLSYIVLMNVNRLAYPRAMVGGPPLCWLGQMTGLDQYWNMFSPAPYPFGGWLRIEGDTADGRIVNLYRHNEPLPEAKPANVSATYDTQYWRRCLVTMYEFKEQSHIDGGLHYFARLWNETHSPADRVVRARFVHMVEHTPPPFAPASEREIERRELGCIEVGHEN